jgi:hypothetical protein
MQTSWVLGFISGAATILGEYNNIAVAETDTAGVEELMTKYCAGHPRDFIPMAALKLVELRARAAAR